MPAEISEGSIEQIYDFIIKKIIIFIEPTPKRKIYVSATKTQRLKDSLMTICQKNNRSVSLSFRALVASFYFSERSQNNKFHV